MRGGPYNQKHSALRLAAISDIVLLLQYRVLNLIKCCFYDVDNRLVADVSAEYGKRHVMDMAKLVQLMIHNGHKFSEAQRIVQRYEPGLRSVPQRSCSLTVQSHGRFK